VEETIRELIIQELVSRAAVIRSGGSPELYATDCGETVYRARPKVDPGDVPCIVIWPRPEEAENIHGQVRHRMPVQIEGIAVFGQTEPSAISEQILGDLIRCFTSSAWDRRRAVAGSPVTYLAPYAESIIYQGGGADAYPEDGSKTVGASAQFQITYWTAIGDPYAP